MPDLRNPIADLQAEIAAEEAAAAETPAGAPAAEADEAPTQAAAEGEPADGEDAPEGEEARAEEAPAKEAADKKAKPAKQPRMVPVERLNEEAVKRRKLEKSIEDMQKRLEALTNPPKPEEQPTPKQRTEQEIRAQERANARLEIQLENFVQHGTSNYSKDAFDAACNKISELIGGPSNLIAIAIEATGSEAAAAKAIYTLGQDDAPEIENFLKLSPIRQAAHLARLATARAKGKQDDAPVSRRRAEPEDEPPAPIRPVKGSTRIEDSLGDDVSDQEFFRRFDEKILRVPRAH